MDSTYSTQRVKQPEHTCLLFNKGAVIFFSLSHPSFLFVLREKVSLYSKAKSSIKARNLIHSYLPRDLAAQTTPCFLLYYQVRPILAFLSLQTLLYPPADNPLPEPGKAWAAIQRAVLAFLPLHVEGRAQALCPFFIATKPCLEDKLLTLRGNLALGS